MRIIVKAIFVLLILFIGTFIKQVLNILDYNRSAIPEAEAYNFIKIKSLGTFLFDCEAFLPSQSIVSASSNSQGLEQIVYSFNEGDLTDFIEQGKVEAGITNMVFFNYPAKAKTS